MGAKVTIKYKKKYEPLYRKNLPELPNYVLRSVRVGHVPQLQNKNKPRHNHPKSKGNQYVSTILCRPQNKQTSSKEFHINSSQNNENHCRRNIPRRQKATPIYRRIGKRNKQPAKLFQPMKYTVSLFHEKWLLATVEVETNKQIQQFIKANTPRMKNTELRRQGYRITIKHITQ